MNIVSKKVSALVFSVIVTTSVVGMDHENMVDQATEQATSAAWYRKSSVQATAAVITLAAVGYACAVRMGKVAIPAFIAAMFVTAKTVQDITPKPEIVNGNSEQTAEVQNQKPVELDASKPETTNAGNTKEEPINLFNDVVNGIKNAIENMTQEDFEQMNADLVR